jgi:hypothetical protein
MRPEPPDVALHLCTLSKSLKIRGFLKRKAVLRFQNKLGEMIRQDEADLS